jgi:type VI secretion system protein ImpA
MLSSDLNNLLEPVSADAPCGADLEYDPAFAELERISQAKAEQQIGETIVPAEEPEWKAVQKKALEILPRGKDLRAAVHLARSLLRTDGWPGFAQGLNVLGGFIETFWEGVYPRLDPDDGNDPTMRINILNGLADGTVLNAVRSTPLVASRTLGKFSLKEVEIAAGETPAPVVPEGSGTLAPSEASIDGAMMDADLAVLQETAAAIKECLAALGKLDTVIAAHVDAGTGPSFGKLTALIRKADQFMTTKLAMRAPVSAGGDASNGVGTNGAGAGPSFVGGAIRSRDDVIKALDAIATYYDRYEPSSPIPLFMARCRKMVMMGFVDIVKELVPDVLSQVEVLKGRAE